MNLEQYLSAVIDTQPHAWLSVQPPGAHHAGVWDQLFTFRRDLLIQLGTSALEEDGRTFDVPWSKGFPDPSAQPLQCYLLYAGAPIFRTTFVYVDGVRALLPPPRTQTDLRVPKVKYELARLFNSLLLTGTESDFDEYLRRAGLQIVSEPWDAID